MEQYQRLLKDILDNGEWSDTGAKLESTGTYVRTKGLFGYQNRYDLSRGFPAVTTKKLAWKAVVTELLWFLSGSTDNRELQAQGVKIWDQWADKDTGDVGPIYGRAWRRWLAADIHRPEMRSRLDHTGYSAPMVEVDQIRELIAGIKGTLENPNDRRRRRLIVTAWNPAYTAMMGLPPCHTLSQFMVQGDRLSCQLYQRSADSFLGVPFNIASYALLTHILARITGLKPGHFVHTFGDVHIYENHFDQVAEVLSRAPYPLPELSLAPELKTLEDFALSSTVIEKITLVHYTFHPALKGEVAV